MAQRHKSFRVGEVEADNREEGKKKRKAFEIKLS